MAEPWTQRVALRWGPELRFYENRIGILRTLQDRGELRAFHVSDEDVRARLVDGSCELVVHRAGLTLVFQTPTPDVAKAWDAASLALSAIKPSRPQRVEVLFQHVAPLDLEFSEALARGYQRFFHLPPLEGDVFFGDWAWLSDLHVEGDPDTSAGMEFGIVRPDEIPGRLERRAGRAARAGGGPQETPNSDEATFADVSLFADSWWRKPFREASSFVQDALEFWDTSRARADRVVASLHLAISDGEH